jgi:hypothetical protein
MSLKNESGGVEHVVVGTSFATNAVGEPSKRAYWIEMGGVPRAFDSIEAIAAELGVRPVLVGTLASSLSRPSLAQSMPISVSNNSHSTPSSADGGKKPSVIYNRLPRASVMLRLALNENDNNDDYSELVTGASMSRPVAISDALALSPRAAPVPAPLSSDPLIESAAPLYASRALPLLAAASADEPSSDFSALPPLPPPVAATSVTPVASPPPPAQSASESSTVRVLLPDADRPVTVRVNRGATASQLVAPALAKRLPVSTLSASSYSFVSLPTRSSPGFIVTANVPLEALTDIIGLRASDSSGDGDDAGGGAATLEMWETPDVRNVALASSESDLRATVLDYGVPLDRMLRVLRLRFGVELGDFLLRFEKRWLQLAVSLNAQGVTRELPGSLCIFSHADIVRALPSWTVPHQASFGTGGDAAQCVHHFRLFAEQRVLARFASSAAAMRDEPPLAVYALEFHTVMMQSPEAIVLIRRGAQRNVDAVASLRGADRLLVAKWFDLLRAASLQSARRVFGVPLDELLRREGRRAVVPQLVHACVSFLRQLEPTPPALFERPGSPQLLALLRAQADGGAPLVLDALDAADAHAVASLLLAFLRELPEPPATFELVARLCNAGPRLAARDGVGADEAAGQFAVAVRQLPAYNADLLRFVCDFLNELSKRQRVQFDKLGAVVCSALVRRAPKEPSLDESAAYWRQSDDDVLADIAPPKPADDPQLVAVATSLIRLSHLIPGPRGVARPLGKNRARGRARSDALSSVLKPSSLTFDRF